MRQTCWTVSVFRAARRMGRERRPGEPRCPEVLGAVMSTSGCTCRRGVRALSMFTAERGLGRQRIRGSAQLDGFLGLIRGITPRRRGATALPTPPWTETNSGFTTFVNYEKCCPPNFFWQSDANRDMQDRSACRVRRATPVRVAARVACLRRFGSATCTACVGARFVAAGFGCLMLRLRPKEAPGGKLYNALRGSYGFWTSFGV